MAVKRGTTGLCFLLGIDKPVGMSSHDVVNRVRRVFGERRVGHTGTLDPAASGVMVVGVGPATRMDAHLTLDDKRYIARITFGAATDTDDAEGEIIKRGDVPDELMTESFARQKLSQIVGKQKQLPPAFSAIKVKGVKAYEAARKGVVIELKHRDIEIYEAVLLGIGVSEEGERLPYWDVAFHVSKGTYIRSIARDLGNACQVPAHLSALRRTSAGVVSLGMCTTLEDLEADPKHAGRLDPLELLGGRFFFADKELAKKISNGNRLKENEVKLYRMRAEDKAHDYAFPCSSTVHPDEAPLQSDEMVAAVAENKVVALYKYNAQFHTLNSCCGFAIGVARGSDI